MLQLWRTIPACNKHGVCGMIDVSCRCRQLQIPHPHGMQLPLAKLCMETALFCLDHSSGSAGGGAEALPADRRLPAGSGDQPVRACDCHFWGWQATEARLASGMLPQPPEMDWAMAGSKTFAWKQVACLSHGEAWVQLTSRQRSRICRSDWWPSAAQLWKCASHTCH